MTSTELIAQAKKRYEEINDGYRLQKLSGQSAWECGYIEGWTDNPQAEKQDENEVQRLSVLAYRYSDERIAAETTCQSLRDQSSRWEAQALEAGVRIAELEARVRELRVALESMVYQFGYDDGKGNFWCGGLSALEEAFETLGWGVKHPIPKGMLCDEPDCKQRATCGTPTPSGYRSVCGEHYRAALAEAPKAGEVYDGIK